MLIERAYAGLGLLALVAVTVPLAASCAATPVEEETVVDAGRPRATATTSANPTATTEPDPEDAGVPTGDCPSGRGSAMVVVGDLASGGFCIDAHETTGKDYEEFVRQVDPTKVQQPEACAWNTDFRSKDPQAGNLPAHGMDWCDAYSYCQFLGKHLCGDRRGGAVRGENTTEDQWYFACSHGADGAHTYPYGATYSRSACNTEKNVLDASALEAVGSRTRCVGGYEGISDMSGNVWEFSDACTAAAGADRTADLCALRGGGADYDTRATCDAIIRRRRDYSAATIGIRCCAR